MVTAIYDLSSCHKVSLCKVRPLLTVKQVGVFIYFKKKDSWNFLKQEVLKTIFILSFFPQVAKFHDKVLETPDNKLALSCLKSFLYVVSLFLQ
jgi:hypothetical protein